MSNKVFQDMTEIERRNKYGHFWWNHAGELIKLNGEAPPLFGDTGPVDFNKLLILFRSNSSLYDKLGRFITVKGGHVWLTSDSAFSTYINSGEKMQFQYSQIINTIEDMITDDFSSLSRKDVEKVLKGFKDLDNAKNKFFNSIDFKKEDNGSYSSSIASTADPSKKLKTEQPIINTNIKLYEQHNEVENLIKNYETRQEVIGRGAIPRKYM